MGEKKFYICKHCGNMIGMIKSSGVNVVCCGDPMTELKPNTVEASQEKHLPVVTVEGNIVKVKVGSVEHPMTKEHHIEWIYLQTAHGGQRRILTPDVSGRSFLFGFGFRFRGGGFSCSFLAVCFCRLRLLLFSCGILSSGTL